MKKSFLSLLLMVPVIAGAIELNPEDECYHIADYEQLKEFATIVNNGSKTACGVLDADIVANENLLDPSTGFPTGCDRYNCSFSGNTWTPMNEFNGTFDGKGHYISGLYVFDWDASEGIFANSTNSAIIKNLGLIDSYIKGGNSTGGFVGHLTGSLQIENSYCSATILGIDVGGFVGFINGSSAELVVRNSYFDGLVAGYPTGAFVGKLDKAKSVQIYNSYTIGRSIENDATGSSSFIGTNDNTDVDITNAFSAGAFVGGDFAPNNTLTVEHSFHMTESEQFDATCTASCAFTSSDVESVTEALKNYSNSDKGIDGSIWGYVDGQPVLNFNGGSSKPEFKGIVLDTLDGVVTATIEASVTGAPSSVVIPENTEVDYVVLDRTFAANKNATLILPFSAKIENAEVYNFGGINQDTEGKWFAVLKKISNSYIEANTAYIIKPSSGSLEFSFGGSKVTLVKNDSVQYETEVGNWRFVGVYDYLKWEEAKIGEGHIYGFSSVADDNISVGQFVRGAYGASVSPTRAFLEFVPTPVASRPGLRKMAAPVELPESIDVVVEDDENTMSIGKLNTVTGEIKSDRWFDMNGRKLDAKPMVNGIYQNNGRQVIVK